MAKKGTSLAERRKNAMANARTAARKAAEAQQHTLVALGASYGLGYAKQKGFQLPTFGGLSQPLLYGATALLSSFVIRDRAFKRVAESMADGLLSVAAFEAGRTGFKTLFSVSGDDQGYDQPW